MYILGTTVLVMLAYTAVVSCLVAKDAEHNSKIWDRVINGEEE